jgi:hypothetical protein
VRVVNDDPSSLLGEAQRDASADSLPAAGDDGDFAFKFHDVTLPANLAKKVAELLDVFSLTVAAAELQQA